MLALLVVPVSGSGLLHLTWVEKRGMHYTKSAKWTTAYIRDGRAAPLGTHSSSRFMKNRGCLVGVVGVIQGLY